MKHLLTGICLLLATVLYAQNEIAFDKSLPATTLDDNTALTLLNARLGSRFSFSYVSSERGMHTGAIGFDNDDYKEFLVEVETEGGKRACFRTSNAPRQVQYLQNQTMRFGMTTMQLEGDHPDKLKVIATVISPFTPTNSLDEEDKLKTQIAPIYYITLKITNQAGKEVKGNFKIGFKGIAYDRDKESAFSRWRRGRNTNTLFFRDGATAYSGTGERTLLAISGSNPNLKHFDHDAFNGLTADFELANATSHNETFILATHYNGRVMQDEAQNIPLLFYYNKFWKNIDEVLEYARANTKINIARTANFEKILTRSQATPQEKWVAAISFHTDLANSFLLMDPKQNPRFYLTEGRFRHLNTIDVAQETELNAIFCPWRLKLQLEQWSGYIATKEVKVPSSRSTKGIKENIEGVSATEFGPFLFHDVGHFPYVFAAEGYDFGPMMPVEENSTYVTLMYWYWKMTGDDAFVKRHLGLIDVLLSSLINRDSDNSGIADYGVGWSTYDVSEAIKRSPENVYLGVKQMCAYVAGAEMLKALPQKATMAKNTPLKTTDEDGNTLDGNMKANFERKLMDNTYLRNKQAERYLGEARKVVASLQKAHKKYGYVPVSLDRSFDGWNQYSIVLPEGLFLLGLGGSESPILKDAAKVLSKTYKQAWEKSKTAYGIKLSSEEDVTWFSKVMVSDIVATYWFNQNPSTANFTYEWNKNSTQAYQDGAFSTTKEWPGNWYPRGISSLGYLLRDHKFKAPQTKDFLKELE